MAGPGAKPLPGIQPRLRLDKWLWHARFCKTRAEAAERIALGEFRINSQRCVKPGHAIGAGDVLTFAQADIIHVIRVRDPGTRRGPAAEARLLYEDVELGGKAAATPLE